MRVLRILVRVLVVLALVAVVLVGAGFLLPSHRETTASVDIDAPAAAIYPKVASFKNGWASWSPFGKAEDPEMQLSFEGPDEGIGATQRWHSQKMPDGAMKIVQADPAKGVTYALEMPDFKMEGQIQFDQKKTTTEVSWTDRYDLGSGPIKRWMGLLVDVTMAPRLQQGLNELKRQVEAAAGHPRG